jgi:hypothetical protein
MLGCASLLLMFWVQQFQNERFNKGAVVVFSRDLSVCVKRAFLGILQQLGKLPAMGWRGQYGYRYETVTVRAVLQLMLKIWRIGQVD